MPLQKQVIHINPATGLDTKSDPKQAQGSAVLTNAEIIRTGEIRKREGMVNLATTIDGAATQVFKRPVGLATYNDRPVLVADQQTVGAGSPSGGDGSAAAYAETVGTWKALNAHGLAGAEFSVQQRAARSVQASATSAAAGSANRSPAIAYSSDGNYLAVAYQEWTDVGAATIPLRLDIWDLASDTLLHSVDTGFIATAPFAFFVSNATAARDMLMVINTNTSANTIQVVRWDATTPNTAPTAAATLASTDTVDTDSGLVATTRFDVVAGRTDLLVAYRITAGGLGERIDSITGANVQRRTITTTVANESLANAPKAMWVVQQLTPSSTTPVMLAYRRSSGNDLVVIRCEEGGAGLWNILSTFVVVAAEVAILRISGGGCVYSATNPSALGDTTTNINHVLVWTIAANTSYTQTKGFSLEYGADSGTALLSVYNLEPYSSVLVHNARLFLMGVYASRESSTELLTAVLVLAELRHDSAGTVVPRCMAPCGHIFANRIVGPQAITGAQLAPPSQRSASVWGWGVPRWDSALGTSGSATTVAKVATGVVVEANFAAVAPQAVISGRDTIIGGTQLTLIDGAAQEVGFVHPPAVRAAPTFNTNGALTGQNYSVKWLYEWWDKHGQRHRSMPTLSRAITTTNASGDAVVDERATTAAGDATKAKNSKSIGYITKSGPGTLFFVDLSESGGSTAADSILANILTAAVQTDSNGVFGDTDASLENNEGLYTDGGELDNVIPPPAVVLLAHKNRVFLISSEDDNEIWGSKERVARVGLSFSDALTIRCPDKAVALGALDDLVAILSENTLWGFGGPGPNALGQGSWSPVQRISSEAGCRDRNSVISTSQGVFFKSAKGFYLLDRSLNVVYIGASVETYNSSVCIGAVELQDRQQIWFLHNDSTGILVYDTFHQAWYRHTMPVGTGQHITTANNKVYVLNTAGTVFEFPRTTSVYTDDASTRVPLTYKSPWIHLEGIQGFQRVWWVNLMGETADAVSTGITVKLYIDYSATASQTVTVNKVNGVWRVRIKPDTQKCQALQIEVADSAPVQPGTTDLRLSQISLVVGVKPGKLARLGSADSK